MHVCLCLNNRVCRNFITNRFAHECKLCICLTGTECSIDKKRVAAVIRKLQRPNGPAEIPSVYKMVKRDLLDVCHDLERLSDEEGLHHLSHVFYRYEGGKAVTKYIRTLHHLLNETDPNREFEINATKTYILILEVVCKLSHWCSEVNLYQQTIESGLLDILLVEIKWVIARRQATEVRASNRGKQTDI